MMINAKHHQRVMEILGEAIERSPESRDAWIDTMCAGDDSLRKEVGRLLGLQTSASQFLEESPLAAALGRQNSDARSIIGEQVGLYKIISEIGRGGMGAVYLAERDDQQFTKRVAIKLIKRGMDTDFVVQRFRNERQILANLDHPNIAKLLDGGTTDSDLPYFIMEYVDGQPITDFATERNLSIDHRLSLFRTVCSTVQYAHQNLVIHRDLKPSNILVTKDGEPKLLDFGIAKLLQTDDAQETGLTATAVRVMTPEYASPEQIEGERITTSSDIYSLGVLLYELLTGNRPYRITSRQPEQLARAICEQQPEKPSTMVTRRKEGPDARKKTDRQLTIGSRQLKGDLDNIVLKALRKEPHRRYASVEQFSEDIRRHLEGLPVSARKDTVAYRTSKFLQRNKLGVAAAGVVLLTLVGGIIATAWQAHRARVQSAMAEQRFNQVRELAHSVIFDYHDEIAALPGSTKVRERLVRDGLKYLDNLSKDAGNDVSLLRELATAYQRVAEVQGGIALSSRGTAVSSSNLGDTKGAIESFNKALAIRERILTIEPNDKDAQQDLANCYAAIGLLYVSTGPPYKAAENLRKAIPIIEVLQAATPTDEILQMNLVNVYAALSKVLGNPQGPNLGDMNGALDYLNKAQPLQEKLAFEHPANQIYKLYVAGLHNNRGWVLNGISGKQPEALEHMKKALAIEQELVEADPANTLFRSQVAIQFTATGRIRLNLGDKHGALEDFKQGLSIAESLFKADPDDASVRRLVAVSYRQEAEAIASTGDLNGGLNNFHKAQQIFAELIAKDPLNEDYPTKLSSVYLAMSRVQSQGGDLNGAVASTLNGIKVEEALVATSPTNAVARSTLAQLDEALGDEQAKLAVKAETSTVKQREQWQAAKDAYQRSLDIYADMKSKGTLNGADASKPDELTKDIAKCDTALKISD